MSVFTILTREIDYIEEVVNLNLDCASLVRESKGSVLVDKEWHCVANKGKYFLIIKYTNGVLSIGMNEREDAAKYSIRPIATSDELLLPDLNFKNIISFLGFKISDNDWTD